MSFKRFSEWDVVKKPTFRHGFTNMPAQIAKIRETKLKFGKRTSKPIQLLIFKTPKKLFK